MLKKLTPMTATELLLRFLTLSYSIEKLYESKMYKICLKVKRGFELETKICGPIGGEINFFFGFDNKFRYVEIKYLGG